MRTGAGGDVFMAGRARLAMIDELPSGVLCLALLSFAVCIALVIDGLILLLSPY